MKQIIDTGTLAIEVDENTRYYGLILQIRNDTGEKSNDELYAIAWDEVMRSIERTDGLTVAMPCGEMFTVMPHTRMPDQDLPCPCGNPRHWLFMRQKLYEPPQIDCTED